MLKLALKNPHAVAVLALAILVVGIVALAKLPTDLLPIFRTPAVQVLTFYPGMPAEIMEKDISSRIQRWTGQANGISRQEAKSMVGVSVVKDFFRDDIDPNAAMSQVTSLAMSDLYYLPPGTIPPMVMPFDPTAATPLALIAVSSPTYDETKLYDVAYFDLRNRLQSITGVIAPAVYGGKLRRIHAYVDRERAQSRGVSPLNVIEALRRNNVMIPTGNAKLGNLEYQINANGMVHTVPEMNDLPLRVGPGPATFIRDVATVEDTAQIQTNIARIDGKRQVYIPIYRQPGANTIQVVEGIKDFMEPIKERVKGVNLDVVMDQSVFVRKAIESLQHEALLGFGLAALMVLIFLRSVRPTLIVLVALPLACLGAAIGLYFTGETINAMTLGGIALVIGLLIDETIVVLENTERHLAMGKSPVQAAFDGAREVTRPLTIVTATLCVVFFPVVFITGMGKFLFTPMAKAVIFAILTSRLLATTLVPVLAARIFKRRAASPDGSDHGHGDEAGWFRGLRRVYVALLRGALRARWLILLGVGGLLWATWLLLPRLGTELFPQTDAGQFTIHVRAPTGLRIELTETMVAGVEKLIQETIPEAERKLVISNIGVLLDWPAAYTPNSGPHDAFILVQLAESRRRSSFDYVALLRERLPAAFPGVEFDFDTGGMLTAALNGGLPSPINIQVEGKDLHVARGIAQSIVAHARGVPGAVDARIQQRLDAPMIEVKVDRVKSAQLGLTQEEVVKNIVTALNSSVNFAPSFWIDESNGNHYFIGAQYREEDIEDLETLLDIPVTGPAQATPVPLRNLASFTRASAPSEVNHVNITRVTDVFVNVSGRDVGGVAADLERFCAGIQNDRARVPEGYKIEMRGEVKSMRESFASLGFAFGLAVLLIYLVMVVQFRSFRDPVIVMGAVPLGLIGVVGFLHLTNTYLSIQAAMGTIMMAGIVTSFSVLLVDFANRLLDEDGALSPREAVVRAAGLRLRAILMTALSAVLGLAPMAIHGGANLPLARAVVGGVVAAVVLVLFVVPILYTLVKRRPAPSALALETAAL